MEDGKTLKSYMVSIQIEVVTNDDNTVESIRLHDIKNEPFPINLWCDFLQRLRQITTGKEVYFIHKGTCDKEI